MLNQTHRYMNIQCPNCKSLITLSPKQFSEIEVLRCSACTEETILKKGSEKIIQIQFVLTESEEKISEEKCVEFFRQKKDLKQPACSSQQLTTLYEEQHEDVQLE